MTHTQTPAKMTAFTIVWHEGTGEFDNMTFRNWAGAQYALNKIYRHHMEDGGQGYTKVKVRVTWENGAEITDRLDVSNHGGDYNAKRESVGDYLRRQNSVMYASTLNQGDRVTLSWADDPQPPSAPKKSAKSTQIKRKPAPAPLTPAKSPKPAQIVPNTATASTFYDVIAMQAETYFLN